MLTLALAAVIALEPVSQASAATWSFEGAIDFMDDDLRLLGGSLSLGDPVSANITFDSETPDSWPDDPRVGGYYQDPILSIELWIGSRHLTIDLTAAGNTGVTISSIRIFDDFPLHGPGSTPDDAIDFSTYKMIGTLDGVVLNIRNVWLSDPYIPLYDPSRLLTTSSDAIPLTPPALPNYEFDVWFSNADESVLTKIHALGTVVAVPEAPLTLPVALILGLLRRTRQRSLRYSG